MPNKFTQEQEKAVEALKPYVQSLLRKVNSFKTLAFAGIIYGYTSGDGTGEPLLMRVGNVVNSGNEYIFLMSGLASMVSDLENTGDVERLNMAAGANAPTAEQLADKLALALMAAPLEEMPEQVRELLNQYLETRKGETA